MALSGVFFRNPGEYPTFFSYSDRKSPARMLIASDRAIRQRCLNALVGPVTACIVEAPTSVSGQTISSADADSRRGFKFVLAID